MYFVLLVWLSSLFGGITTTWLFLGLVLWLFDDFVCVCLGHYNLFGYVYLDVWY